MRDTLEMAREACVSIRGHYDETGSTPQELERLVALARADERERIADESKHIIKRAEARGAAVEREACAKVCESAEEFPQYFQTTSLPEAIRARGETK